MALELVTPLPPGAPSHTRLAKHGDRLVVLREILDGTDCSWPAPAPRLVTLQEVGEIQGKRHALFEWVPGVTLRETLAALELVGRPAPLGLVGRVLLDTARALSAVTPARTHGGLSDGALQLGFDGVVSVLDWGAPRLSRFRPLGRVNFAYDVFTLGAVMHSALTGYVGDYASLPPTLPPPSTSHAEATPALDDVVMRALNPHADGRQANLGAFADELEAVLGDDAYTTAQLADVVRTLFKERIKLLQSLGGLFGGPDELEAELPEATRPPMPAHIPLGTSIPMGTQPGQGGPPSSAERTETRVPLPGERTEPKPLKPWNSASDLEAVGPAEDGTQPGVFAPSDAASSPVRPGPAPREEATNPGAPMPPPRRGGDTGPEPALQLSDGDPEALAAAHDAARSGGPRPMPEPFSLRATGPRAGARASFDDPIVPRGGGPRPAGDGVTLRATGSRSAVDDAARTAGPRPSAGEAIVPRASNARALADAPSARASGPRPGADAGLAPRASSPRAALDDAPSARASGPRPGADAGLSPRASSPRASVPDDTAPRALGPRPGPEDAPTAPPSPRASGARAVLRDADAPSRAGGGRVAAEDPPLAALGEPTQPRARMPAPPPGRGGEPGAAPPFDDTQPRARAPALSEDTAPRARGLSDDERARARGQERLPTPPRGIEVQGEDYAELNEPTAVRARADAAITNAQTAQRLPSVPAPGEGERSGSGGLRGVMVFLLLVVVGLAGAAVYKLRNGTLGAPVTAPALEPELLAEGDAGVVEAPSADAGTDLDAGLAAVTLDGDAGALADGGGDAGDGAPDAGLAVGADSADLADAGAADAGAADAKPPAKKPARKKRR